jgi:hypothetical protein
VEDNVAEGVGGVLAEEGEAVEEVGEELLLLLLNT